MNKHILLPLFLHITISILFISCKFYEVVKNKNKLFYITSIEKQNTASSSNLKNIKLLKKKNNLFC